MLTFCGLSAKNREIIACMGYVCAFATSPGRLANVAVLKNHKWKPLAGPIC
jgi:hypothetical protein